jgi:GntR family transcriptional regulator / MocR family aminotransferase
MAESWAISGVDIHLDRTGSRVRAGLETALRDAVRSGRLKTGMRLPSSRSLAADLGIARNTVADAYGQLVAEGWLVARQGSGTRVAAHASAGGQHAARPGPAVDRPRPARYDLTPGQPDTAAFPRAVWLAAARRALSVAPAEALGYADPRGRPELRTALAGYLARVRGVIADPERIVICAGFTQGLGLLCRALRSGGARSLAMEAYGVQDHRRIATGNGLSVTSLPVDDDGAQVDELGRSDAVLLTAAHQFPIGATLSPERRTRAIEWASATAGIVIEDDYDGEFRYDRQPVGALQALAPDRVVYAGTASKSLAPGVRLGWLVLPAALIGPVTEAQSLAVRSLGALDQLTLAELITSGAYDRHIRRARLAYRRRRDRLLATLAREAPTRQVTGIAAGLHALVTVSSAGEEAAIVAAAARRGMVLEGLGTFSSDAGSRRAGLVIGYGTPPDHAYTGAIARLTAALADGHDSVATPGPDRQKE